MNHQEMITKLQLEVKQFVETKSLKINGITILPKEVEAYYYKKGVFEDQSVHKNELQSNNKYHFYIHRWGTKRTDSYKGGNYPGIDFVVSDDSNLYYSYLIRSAVVEGKMVVGPHKVLKAIEAESGLSFNEIENTVVEVINSGTFADVLFSNRINLGKTVPNEDRICKFRAVLCDETFRNSKYPSKELMLVDFLLDKVQSQTMTKEEAYKYAKKHLGYIPSSIKSL